MKNKLGRKSKLFLVMVILLAVFISIFGSVSFKPSEKTEEILENHLTVKIESPLNQTYFASNVILKAVASKDANWMAESIDGSQNVIECYSCNSYALYYLNFGKGTHTITVFASDSEDKIIQSSITFTVV